MQGSRYKFVNFGTEKSLGSPDWSDQIDGDKAASVKHAQCDLLISVHSVMYDSWKVSLEHLLLSPFQSPPLSTPDSSRTCTACAPPVGFSPGSGHLRQDYTQGTTAVLEGRAFLCTPVQATRRNSWIRPGQGGGYPGGGMSMQHLHQRMMLGGPIFVYKYVYTCLYIYTYIYIYMCISIYLSIFLYIYIYIYICIHTDICIYIYMIIHKFFCIYNYT